MCQIFIILRSAYTPFTTHSLLLGLRVVAATTQVRLLVLSMCWLCLYSTAKCFKRSHHLNARCACQLPRDVLFLVECFSSFPLGVGRQTFHHTQVPWLHQRQSQVLRRMHCTSGPPPHIIRVSFVFPAVDGELNFGGVDSAHYTGVFAYTNFESTSEWPVLAKNFLAIKSTESFPSLVCLACNTRDISFAKLGKLLLLPLASKVGRLDLVHLGV